ncbi:unnamed protein product, partial [Didymodactylos carnosus]
AFRINPNPNTAGISYRSHVSDGIGCQDYVLTNQFSGTTY